MLMISAGAGESRAAVAALLALDFLFFTRSSAVPAITMRRSGAEELDLFPLSPILSDMGFSLADIGRLQTRSETPAMAHIPASNAPASEDATRPDGQRFLAVAAIIAAGLVLLAGLGAWAVFGPAVAFEMMAGAIWNCF